MAAGSTYTPIATQTLGSSASTVTFSSIPSTYTDLVLIVNSASNTGTNYPNMRFNSDSGTNYSRTALWGNGSTQGSGRDSNITIASLCYNSANTTTANGFTAMAHIMNYANTSTYKTAIVRANNAGNAVEAIVDLWRSTAAISSIVVGVDSNSYAAGSTFTLYGIAAA